MLRTDNRLLRGALLGNAAFSGMCALPLIVLPQAVGSWLGLSQTLPLIGLGLGLGAFAAALIVLATRPLPPSSWVLAVIAADASWVAGTVILFFTPLAGALSPAGVWAVALVAAVVAFWGALQTAGLLAMDHRTQEARS